MWRRGETGGGAQVLRRRGVGVLTDRVADVAGVVAVLGDAGYATHERQSEVGDGERRVVTDREWHAPCRGRREPAGMSSTVW